LLQRIKQLGFREAKPFIVHSKRRFLVDSKDGREGEPGGGASKGKGILSSAIGAIIEPAQTFRGLAGRPPGVWASFVVVLLLSVISSALILPKSLSEEVIRGQVEARLESAGVTMSDEDIDRQVSIGRTAGMATGIVGAAVVSLVVVLIEVGFIQFVAQFMGGLGRFRQVLAVVCFASIPNYLGAIIKGVLVFTSDLSGLDMSDLRAVQDALSPQISLAVFFGREEIGLFPWTLLSTIDPFLIWSLVLIALGVSIVHKISVGKAGFISALIWAGTVALSFLAGLLGNRAMSLT
jgi:hypothetical protein